MPAFSDDPRKREAEEKCLADIATFGLHVLQVHGDAEWPAFTYSVGLFATLGLPELIILGLRTELAHSILNRVAERAREGEQFRVGERIAHLVQGFDILVNPVNPEFVEPHFGWAMWYYGDRPFPVAQLVYPTTAGIWPWDPDASESFRWTQPLLDRAAIPAWVFRET